MFNIRRVWGLYLEICDVFVTRNELQELNSSLYQLAYGKLDVITHGLAKYTVFKNLSLILSEDLVYRTLHWGWAARLNVFIDEGNNLGRNSLV